MLSRNRLRQGSSHCFGDVLYRLFWGECACTYYVLGVCVETRPKSPDMIIESWQGGCSQETHVSRARRDAQVSLDRRDATLTQRVLLSLRAYLAWCVARVCSLCLCVRALCPMNVQVTSIQSIETNARLINSIVLYCEWIYLYLCPWTPHRLFNPTYT